MRARALAVLLAAAGSLLPAQTASYTCIPQPPPNLNPNPPMLVALNTPRVGQMFQIQTATSGWSNLSIWAVYVVTGISNPAMDLGPIDIPSYLFSSAESVVALALNASGLRSYPIPNSSALVGVSFNQQVYYDQRNLREPAFQRSSRGGHGVIGTWPAPRTGGHESLMAGLQGEELASSAARARSCMLGRVPAGERPARRVGVPA